MITILQGDALAKLRELPDESVQMCVTSPPYWNLRDYGTATWEGGDSACDHVSNRGKQGTNGTRSDRTHTQRVPFTHECGKCGAIRVDQQLGLEKTPEEFVSKLVAIFSELRRVLRKDGTCWINIGDSYSSNAGGYNSEGSMGAGDNLRISKKTRAAVVKNRSRTAAAGLKAKDMVGIPWRVAFALQADGWYLRQDIIWSKPNPMPESVTDRCTKSHEYLFLLSKSERYYYDAKAIKEPVSGTAHARGNGVNPKARFPTGWASDGTHRELAGRYTGPRSKQNESFSGAINELVENRNKRSVWTVPTFPCPDAHFATYPPDLIKPCILAGSKPGDVVLDPFGGSGTTGEVAIGLGRQALLIELNPSYIELIKQRCHVTPGLGI